MDPSVAQNIRDALVTQRVDIPVWDFALNLLIAAILAYVLSRVYEHFGHSLSNRKVLARNFVLITMTTMLIITIVKSSLALSLGLVGALSIVRFRTAIKEPEELAYLFLSISIGLGLGADQRLITLIAFAVIVTIIWLHSRQHQGRDSQQNLYLTVSSHNPKKAELGAIVDTLSSHCSAVSLKRLDDTKELLEASFLVEFGGYPQLQAAIADLHGLGDDVNVTFLDNNGIGGI